jgi:hypothetical protein
MNVRQSLDRWAFIVTNVSLGNILQNSFWHTDGHVRSAWGCTLRQSSATSLVCIAQSEMVNE